MIYYKAGYKYQLYVKYECYIEFEPIETIVTPFISLNTDGKLTIDKGYAWDGPSGPTFDTKPFMRPSLIHDATYQLMREGHVPRSYRDTCDRELQKNCIADGMWTFKAWVVYQAVKWGGKYTSRKQDIKPMISAP